MPNGEDTTDTMAEPAEGRTPVQAEHEGRARAAILQVLELRAKGRGTRCNEAVVYAGLRCSTAGLSWQAELV